MTPDELRAEIVQDPMDYGYRYSTGRWRGRSTICALLNLRHRIKLRLVSSTDLMDAIRRAELDALNAPDTDWLFNMLQVSGSWNFDGESMQGELKAIFEGSQTWAAWEALAAGKFMEQSRAQFLWGDETEVTTDDVKEAAAL